MNLPESCPHCGARCDRFGKIGTQHMVWIIRTSLDWDGDINQHRIEDQIFECSNCHTLFRARWRLMEFNELYEKIEEVKK